MLEIISYKNIESTHLYLINAIKERDLSAPIAIVADTQSAGIGSRNNEWRGLEGNLFLSFCIDRKSLPSDLPVSSMSIYFAFVLKEFLSSLGSKVWIKWPNDFYIDEKKIGGVITKLMGENIICSIGLNLKNSPENFGKLDIRINKFYLLSNYFLKLKNSFFWKEIFIKYQVEFSKSRSCSYYDSALKRRVSLEDAVLVEDGSIMIENRRVYSLR